MGDSVPDFTQWNHAVRRQGARIMGDIMAVYELELVLGEACRAIKNGVNLYFVCVLDPSKDTWTTEGHLDKALAYVETDMHERNLYQIACCNYGTR